MPRGEMPHPPGEAAEALVEIVGVAATPARNTS